MPVLNRMFKPAAKALGALGLSTALTTSALADSPWDKMRVTPPSGDKFFGITSGSGKPSFSFEFGKNGASVEFNIPGLNIIIPRLSDSAKQAFIDPQDALIIQQEIIRACHPQTSQEDAAILLPRCSNEITEEMISYALAYANQVAFEHQHKGLSTKNRNKSILLIGESIQGMVNARDASYHSLGHRIEAMSNSVIQTAKDLVEVNSYTGLTYRPKPWAVILNGAYHLSNNPQGRGYDFKFEPKNFYDVPDVTPSPTSSHDSNIDSNEHFPEYIDNTLPKLPEIGIIRERYVAGDTREIRNNILITSPGTLAEAQYDVQAISVSNTVAQEMRLLSERYRNAVLDGKYGNASTLYASTNHLFDKIQREYDSIEDIPYESVGQRIEGVAKKTRAWGQNLVAVDKIIKALTRRDPGFEAQQFYVIDNSNNAILGSGRTRDSVIDVAPDIEYLKTIPIFEKTSAPAAPITGTYGAHNFEIDL
jgi:hypothetical protein